MSEKSYQEFVPTTPINGDDHPKVPPIRPDLQNRAMKQAEFPIRVRMGAAALTELHSCEYGSYEDHIKQDGTREGEYADGTLHCVEIIERGGHKTVVILKSQDELEEFFAQAMTGTWSMYCLRTAQRIYRELEDYCRPENIRYCNYGTLGY